MAAANTYSLDDEAEKSIHDGENLVDFDGSEDPLDPVNWSPVYKWFIVFLISVMSLVVYVYDTATSSCLPRLLNRSMLLKVR